MLGHIPKKAVTSMANWLLEGLTSLQAWELQTNLTASSNHYLSI